MIPRQYKSMKRKLRRFWKEWGITKWEFEGLMAVLLFFTTFFLSGIFFKILGF